MMAEQPVNIIKTAELYTVKLCILWYVNFISIKKGQAGSELIPGCHQREKQEVEKTPAQARQCHTGDAVFTHNGEIKIPNYKT